MKSETKYIKALFIIMFSWCIYSGYKLIFGSKKVEISNAFEKTYPVENPKEYVDNKIEKVPIRMGKLGMVHTPKMTNKEIRERLGRSTWTLLHTMAAVYPAFPTVQHKKDTLQFIYLLSSLYPCGDCCQHFQKLLSNHPPQVGSHDEFVAWLCKAHNVVNKRLGKSEFDCAKIEGVWQCGCSPD